MSDEQKFKDACDLISASGEWAVVPVEASDDMVNAGAEAWQACDSGMWESFKHCYRAMLQARPKVAG